MTEEGTKWGFADDCEAVSHPMTPEERRVWFDPRHRVSMLFYDLIGLWDMIGNEKDEGFDAWNIPND